MTDRPTALRRFILLALPMALVLPAAMRADESAGARHKAEAGPHKVKVLRHNWTDEARTRKVPVKVYLPEDGKGPFPVIIYSHGLGGSREGYEYLGTHWAGHGYVSVHLQHVGSDESVWKGKPVRDVLPAMRKAAAEPSNAIERPRDVSFAIDRLTELNRTTEPYRQRLDLDRIGVGGHSFGAFTANAVGGTVFVTRLEQELSVGDPRVKAIIPMSSPVPGKAENLEKMFAAPNLPAFHMTGTHDTSIINDTTAGQRKIPYRFAKHPDTYLLVFADGDHMVFSGPARGLRARSRDKKRDALFHSLIQQSTTAFWDACLKGDDKARAWLRDGAFEKLLGKSGTFEHKPDQAK